MNNRIDERKVSKYLYEIAGRAGTICRTTLGKGGNPNKLCRGPKKEQEPEYQEAMRLYLTLSDAELEARLAPTRENVMHPCGTPLQWDTYCRIIVFDSSGEVCRRGFLASITIPPDEPAVSGLGNPSYCVRRSL